MPDKIPSTHVGHDTKDFVERGPLHPDSTLSSDKSQKVYQDAILRGLDPQTALMLATGGHGTSKTRGDLHLVDVVTDSLFGEWARRSVDSRMKYGGDLADLGTVKKDKDGNVIRRKLIPEKQRIADQELVDSLPAKRAKEAQDKKYEADQRSEARGAAIGRGEMTAAEAIRAMDDPSKDNPLYIPYHKRTRAEQKMLEKQRDDDIAAANKRLEADKTAGEARLTDLRKKNEESDKRIKKLQEDTATMKATREAREAKEGTTPMSMGDKFNPSTLRWEDKDGKTAQERDADIIAKAKADYEEEKYGKGGQYDPTKPFVGPDQQRRSDELDTYTDKFFNKDAKKAREEERQKSIKDLRDARDAKNTAADDARAQKLNKQKDMSASDIRAASEQRVKDRRTQQNAKRRQRILDSDRSDDEKQELLERYSGSKGYSREESMAASKKSLADRRFEDREDMSDRNERNREGRLDAFISPDKRDAREERRDNAFLDLAAREKKAQQRRDEISKNRQAAANKRRGRQKHGNQSVSPGYVGGAPATGTPTPEEMSYARNEYAYYMRQMERQRAEWAEFQRWKRGGRGYADGGSIPSSSDTVPAMLTPGEFVMSREAVQSHGVGYMKQLNKGHVPGFNRGGVVGRGNVQYRQDGGLMSSMVQGAGAMLGLDTSDLSGILEGFQGGLISGLDGVVKQFTGVEGAFTNLAATFSNLTMQHSFSGDMTLAFNITNADAIKNAVADAITPKITEIITNELDVRLDKDFKVG
jgi:hypothetical protein